jgi:hypothetical protein
MGLFSKEVIRGYSFQKGEDYEVVCKNCIKPEDEITQDSIIFPDNDTLCFCDRCEGQIDLTEPEPEIETETEIKTIH